MRFGKRSSTPPNGSAAEQALKKSLVKQKRPTKAATTEGTTIVPREPIPPPPPPPSRAEHLRPASPSLVRSGTPHKAAGRPSTSSNIHGYPVNRHPTTFVVGAPWATPPVDRLMCALDARDLSIPEIIRRLKSQFPTLGQSVITSNMVSTRLQLLDQRVDIDYFKYGIGLGKRSIEDGVGFTRGARHGAAIHHASSSEAMDTSKGRGKGPAIRPRTSTGSLTTKQSQASLKTSRGALHGLAIQEEAAEEADHSKEQIHSGGPISSSASTSLVGGAKHGRLIHDQGKRTAVGGVAAPFSSTAGSSVRGGSSDVTDRQNVIHHRRELSEISGTTVALDSEPSTTLSIKRPVERAKLIKTNFDVDPAPDTEKTPKITTPTMPSISITPPLSSTTGTRASSRAAKLGLAIHTAASKDRPSKVNNPLQITNVKNNENSMPSPDLPSSSLLDTLPVASPLMESKPFEYRRNREAVVDKAAENILLETTNRSPGGLGNAFKDASPMEIKRKVVSKPGDDNEKRQWIRESVEMKALSPGAPKLSAESWVREGIVTGGLRDERIA